MGVAAAVPEHVQAQHRVEFGRQREGIEAVGLAGHVLGQRVDREDHVSLGCQFGLGAPGMYRQRGIALEAALLQGVVERNQRRSRTAGAARVRHEDMAAIEVLLERQIVLEQRMVLARANPEVQRRHHLLDDLRMPGREWRKCEVQLVGTHRSDVRFP
ncbi:hypothetical protein D3C86_1184760 [compost metagenome]